MHLTEKQHQVYRFIREYIRGEGHPPTYREIQHAFGFKSVNSVEKYIAALKERGALLPPGKEGRPVLRLAEEGEGTLMIPLLGDVAAGPPIEAIEWSETVEVPRAMLGKGEYFGLKVKGYSMVDDGILDGDLIIFKRQHTAENGQTVVALVDGEATVKKYFRKPDGIELRPANPTMSPILVRGADFRIQGIFAGLMRMR
jgi:repressor LexA